MRGHVAEHVPFPAEIFQELARQFDRIPFDADPVRSEEHTSELQSQSNLVCRLLLDKTNKNTSMSYSTAQMDTPSAYGVPVLSPISKAGTLAPRSSPPSTDLSSATSATTSPHPVRSP